MDLPIDGFRSPQLLATIPSVATARPIGRASSGRSAPREPAFADAGWGVFLSSLGAFARL
jgi:hypothetical protein